jgi:hypothetical protein
MQYKLFDTENNIGIIVITDLLIQECIYELRSFCNYLLFLVENLLSLDYL